MTTPAGVPNLPVGALTVETLAERLQNQTPAAHRARAAERMPGALLGNSHGGNPLSDLSPFGLILKIFAAVSSRIATADPADIQGPSDLPALFTDFIEALPMAGTETLDSIYAQLSELRDRADEMFSSQLDMQLANAAADALVDWKARAGSNLFLDPEFSVELKRFPVSDLQTSSYSVGEQHKSGLKSWKWYHHAGVECGLKLAPTTRINHYQVAGGEVFSLWAFVHPDAANATSPGSIRIGGTLTDESGALPDQDIYADFPLNGPDMVKGQFNKITISVTIEDGYDRAVFWVKSTANVPANSLFFIDSCGVRENTAPAKAQAQADFATFVTDLKARAGTNACFDPRFSLGRTVTRFPFNVAQDFDYTHDQHLTGLWSWKWVQKTAAACGLVLAPTPKYDSFQVAGGESYFVQAFLMPDAANSTAGAVRVGATLTDSTGTLSPIDMFVETALSSAAAARGQWNPLSCTLTILDGFDTAKFWVIGTAGVAASSVFYVGAICVRETTHPQSIIDKIHEAILGAVPSSPQPVGSIADRLKEAWSSFWDGLHGSTGSTGKLPSDVQVAAAAVRSAAATATTNAATAQASASTAQTTANTAASDLSSSLNNMAGGLLGGSQTATPTTIRDKILAAWAQLFDGLNGSSGSSARLITEVGTAAAAVRSTASTASTNAATAQASASTAQSTASGAQSAIAATNTALYGGSSAGSTILPAALPTKLQTLGSGFVMRKTSGTIGVSCSANTATGIRFKTSDYDAAASNTGDYTVTTDGSGRLLVTATVAGWYMVEVAFGIKQTARAVGYRIAAAIYKNSGNMHKVGSTVDYYGSLSAQIPFACQGAFIVYLDGSEYVSPGALLYSQSTISNLDIIGTNFGADTYFSVSLLNRSLA